MFQIFRNLYASREVAQRRFNDLIVQYVVREFVIVAYGPAANMASLLEHAVQSKTTTRRNQFIRKRRVAAI
ncbi:MAG: hypothetical protein BGN99_28180 [Alphaproteobacteria bacterium 65-37]|nr:MAG: hypothetical protein BGN99_28180 [Alphaproteobacteria bacterium 65-37]